MLFISSIYLLGTCLQRSAVAFMVQLVKSPVINSDLSSTHCRRGERYAFIPHLRMLSRPSEEELAQQKIDAVREFSRYHDGVWRGKRVTSFSINSDVAAGVTKRSDAKDTTGDGVYKAFVRTLMEPEGLRVQETTSWDEADDKNNKPQPSICDKDEVSNKKISSITSRSINFCESVDIDSVDASYSLDSSPFLGIPNIITGTNKVVKFGIEHCIAVSDHERVRCFLMYDMADKLTRVALCDEVRVEDEEQARNITGPFPLSQLSFEEEVIAAQNDVNELMDWLLESKEQLYSSAADSTETKKGTNEANNASILTSTNEVTPDSSIEERMEKLRKALQNTNLNDDSRPNEVKLKRNPMSFFSLISGVWLGDCVVRNHFQPAEKDMNFIKSQRGKSPSNTNGSLLFNGFAEWSIGVQKVAVTFKWDFEERVMQQYTAGRSLGVTISNQMPAASMGVLIKNDMARGRDSEDRMAYIDFDMGMYAGFLLGSVYIKAPRSLSFSYSTGRVRPFFTEFAVFQKKSGDLLDNADAENPLFVANLSCPELYCSRQTRLYGNNGRLQQGTSSFFNLEYIANLG